MRWCWCVLLLVVVYGVCVLVFACGRGEYRQDRARLRRGSLHERLQTATRTGWW